MLSVTSWCQQRHIPPVSWQGTGSTGAACPIQVGQCGGSNYSEVKALKRIFLGYFFPHVPFFLREVENKAQQEMYKPTSLLEMVTKPQAESELCLQCYFSSLWVLQSKVNSNNFIGMTKARVITGLRKKNKQDSPVLHLTNANCCICYLNSIKFTYNSSNSSFTVSWLGLTFPPLPRHWSNGFKSEFQTDKHRIVSNVQYSKDWV